MESGKKAVRLIALFLVILLSMAGAVVKPKEAHSQKEPFEPEVSRETITVNAPASFVFPYISQGDKIAQWAHDNKLKISFPRGKDAHIGMQVKFTIRLPTSPHWTVEIRKLEQDARMETDFVEGIFQGSLSFYLERIQEDRTLLIHEATIIPQGSFMRFAWDTAGRKIHGAKIKELMEKIKLLIETDWQKQR